MATSGFKLNPGLQKQWKEAMGELRAFTKKESPESIHKLVNLSARRFVLGVASVTPPASGILDATAKKQGEQAILDDLLKIAIPVAAVTGSRRGAREVLASAQDLIAAHENARNPATGRTRRRSKRDMIFTSESAFNRAVTQLQARVGMLAAGLNAAAARLGAHLPLWVTRHGNRFGKIEVTSTASSIKVRVVQNVPFADNVRDYGRHWDFALQKEITALKKQVVVIFEKQKAKAKARLAKRH